MLDTLLTVLLVIVLIAVPVLLQYYLSRRKNSWAGLILPVLFVLYSVLMMVQVTIYSFDSILDVFVQMIVVFFLCNIPTLVLVVIYAACRSKMEQALEEPSEKMNDL